MTDIEAAGGTLIALSVDPPETSRGWADEKGFSFPLISDVDMAIIDRFKIRNPDKPDLPLHAVYVIDPDGTIRYAKVAGRRVKSPEIAHALNGDDVECCPGQCGELPACRPIDQ